MIVTAICNPADIASLNATLVAVSDPAFLPVYTVPGDDQTPVLYGARTYNTDANSGFDTLDAAGWAFFIKATLDMGTAPAVGFINAHNETLDAYFEGEL